ncbi:anti-sigma factor domain-containing protein [Paraburkholderia sp. BL21I4N1]|uniref:anti-sigma factor n=1 Tax=Paraburkholderia sp. BL21I4N1 TaxID=1938801 RepID=UPI000CFB1953|nr:anti-sigma factor [Paraburkholderia sp. BL21I4N1]PQV54517.1 anti-sigma-K factor RskA [Paraburkholderia sp. BL21I4N1]
MNLHRYPRLVDLLAAEYVLGTLRGGARRRFQLYAEHDTTVRRAVDEWQRRISPMAELAEPRMPPAEVWQAIERRLGLTATREAARPRTMVETPPRPSRSLFENLAFWRGWALGVTGLAAVAVVVAVRSLLPSSATPATAPVVAQQPETAVSHVAVLNNKDSHPVMLVAWDEAHSTMTLHPLGNVELPAGRAMELWGIPASGHPVALGMLPDSASGKVPAGQQKPESYAALAVSIEAPGGSPNPNAPSGPVVFSGKLLPVS